MNETAIVPRHPVQLYEAVFYFLIFLILYFLSKRPYLFYKEGKLIGLFFIFVFTSRFFVEFLKEKQSLLLTDTSSFLMGHYLSIPFIIIGVILFFWTEIKFMVRNRQK